MAVKGKEHKYLSHYEYMTRVFYEKFNYQLYFIGGNLLGFIRDGKFLDNERDMDVSYFSKYKTVYDVKQELIEIIIRLVNDGEQIYLIRPNYTVAYNYFKWKVEDGERIDVMPTWVQNGMIYRPTFVGYRGNEDIILPLKEVSFYGHTIYIPNKPEVKLTNVYGENWRVPDDKFKKSDRTSANTRLILNKKLKYDNNTIKHLVKLTGEWKKLSLKGKLSVIFNINFNLYKRFVAIKVDIIDRYFNPTSYSKRLKAFPNIMRSLYLSFLYPWDISYPGRSINYFKYQVNFKAEADQLRENYDSNLSREELYAVFSSVRSVNKLEGAIAEVGECRSLTAKMICEAKGGKHYYIFHNPEPSFANSNKPKHSLRNSSGSKLPSEDLQTRLKGYQNVHYTNEEFITSVNKSYKEQNNMRLCFVHLDLSSFHTALEALKTFYPRLVTGGRIIAQNYNIPKVVGGSDLNVKDAFLEYFKTREHLIIETVDTQCMVCKL